MQYERSLRKELLEMWQLVQSQLSKCCLSLQQNDKDLAREVILIEDRVDSSEFLIDGECRRYIAVNGSASLDLSFAMAALKINMHLERIGDIAEDVAYHILNSRKQFSKELFLSTGVLKTFTQAINFLERLQGAFGEYDAETINGLINNELPPENINQSTNKLIIEHVKDHPEQIDQSLHVLSIIRNLEGVFDQIRGIAQECAEYLENAELSFTRQI